MPDLSFLPPAWQGAAAALFILCMIVFAAWSHVFGRREGPQEPKVKEFYASGQLADMGPVKELVETAGLVMQQMVRTNIALEETVKSLNRLGDLVEHRIEEERRDREIAEEVRRQLGQGRP